MFPLSMFLDFKSCISANVGRFHEKLRRFIKREQADRTVEQIPVRVMQIGTKVTLRGTSSSVNALAAKVNTWYAPSLCPRYASMKYVSL
jgi:hypothetical protein